jgi:hypothetical protein
VQVNAVHASRVLLGQLELQETMVLLAKTVRQVKTELKEKTAELLVVQLQQRLVPHAHQVLLAQWEKREPKDQLGRRALQVQLATLVKWERRVWLDQKE